MDWKENLGKIMTANHWYRLDMLNKQLGLWCKEWVDYVNEFNGNSANLSFGKFEFANVIVATTFITVYDNRKLSYFPFKARLGYFVSREAKLTLYFASTERVNYDLDVQMKIRERESDLLYIWHNEDEITDAEFFEQGFVLQLLNNRFQLYIGSNL